LEEHERAGIATFVMRGKEYLIAITSENGILRADTLRFAEELRTAADVGLPQDPPKVKPADLKKMKALIKSHATAKVPMSELEDEYSEQMQKLVKKKERKHQDIYELPVDETEKADADVIDLVEVLRRSLKSA
jgi:DNA end-binding protein Ku